MTEVSEKDFFATIGKLDVHPRPVGKHPYSSEWRRRDTMEIVGMTIPDENGEDHYFDCRAKGGES